MSKTTTARVIKILEKAETGGQPSGGGGNPMFQKELDKGDTVRKTYT